MTETEQTVKLSVLVPESLRRALKTEAAMTGRNMQDIVIERLNRTGTSRQDRAARPAASA